MRSEKVKAIETLAQTRIYSAANQVRRFYFGRYLIDILLIALLTISAMSASTWLLNVSFLQRIVLIGLMGFGVVAVILATRKHFQRWKETRGSIAILEKTFPDLQSDVTTLAEWHRAKRQGRLEASKEFLNGLEETLTTRIEHLPIEKVFGSTSLVANARIKGIGILFLGVSLLFLPNPFQRNLLLTQSNKVLPPGWLASAGPLEIGNVQVKYTFPKYTKMSPTAYAPLGGKAIEALIGTQVDMQFQSNLSMSEVGIVLPGGEYIEATAQDSNQFSVQFTIRESGILGIQGKDMNQKSRQDPIGREVLMVSDMAPKITITKPEDEIEVDISTTVQFQYLVEDDFGLRQIGMEIQGDGVSQNISLGKIESRRHQGTYDLRLNLLPIGPDVSMLTVTLTALDIDEVSGAKEGRSKPIRLRFKNVEEARAARLLSIENWLNILIPILANVLERPTPATLDESWVTSWTTDLERLKSLRQEIEDQDSSQPLKKTLRTRSKALVERRTKLLKYLEVNSGFWSRFRKDYLNQISAETKDLEGLILFLDDMAARERADQLTQESREMSQLAKQLRDQLEGSDLGDTLDQIEQKLAELSKAASALSEQGPPEFLNREALETENMQSAASELEEIRKLLEAGKEDEARQRMEALLDQLSKLGEELEKEGQSMTSEAAERLREKFNAIEKSLEETIEKQRQLLDKSAELRNQIESRLGKSESEFPKELIEKARTLIKQLRKGRLESSEPHIEATVPAIEGNAKELLKSLEGKKLDSGLKYVQEVSKSLQRLLRFGNVRRGLGRDTTGMPNFHSAAKTADEIKRALEKMKKEQSNMRRTPQELELGAKLSAEQDALKKRAEELRQQMRELEQNLPGIGGMANENIGNAMKSMGEAATQLNGGEPSQAMGNQRKAISSLEKMGNQMNQAMQQMRPGARQPRRQESWQGLNSESILIPGESRKEKTEAWRKALMEAMKEKAPEGFEETTREYFEELAR